MAGDVKFGMDVHRRRLAVGATQQELAEKAGIHRATVRYVESGRSVSDLTRVRISNALAEVEAAANAPASNGRDGVELLALNVAVTVLEGLKPDERVRVLNYLTDRFGGAA